MRNFKSVKKLTSIVLAVMMVLSCVVVGVSSANNVKIAFTNNKGWSKVNIYSWDGSFNSCTGDWPGTQITNTSTNDYGETVYYAEIPSNVSGIVFNDGGNQQTADISFNGQPTGWYMTNQNGNGNWNVETWAYSPEGQTSTTATADTNNPKTVYFTNDKGWGNITAFAWNTYGDAVVGDWPGQSMTKDYTNDYGQDVYKITLPAAAVGVVFSNNGSDQTVDITPVDNTGYYATNKNGEGNYEVGVWAPVKDVQTTTAKPQGTTATVDTSVEKTIYFTNDKNWSNIKAYAWDKDENALIGDFPGTGMTKDYTNTYGQDVYKIKIPAGAVGVVISDNGGAQTVDITPADNTGYYCTSQNSENKWEVQPWSPVKTDGTTGPTTVYDDSAKVVYFTNNQNWANVKAYAWDKNDNGLLGDYPGTGMTKAYTNDYGQDVYKITVPEGAVGVVFSDNGGAQTVDVTPAKGTGYYPTNQGNDGKWEVATWAPVVEPTTAAATTIDTTTQKTVYFTNNQNWANVKAYAWDSEDQPLLGDYPGTGMTKDSTNGYGQDVYRIIIPAGAVGVVFSDNGGAQTVDIVPFDNTDYYPTSQNEDTRWEVDTWYPVKETTGTTGTIPPGPKTIYFTNNQNWANVKAYAWNKDNDGVIGDWPGTGMTYDHKNTYGEDIYKIVLPEGAVGVVFSDNGGTQTVDLVPVDNTGYYPDSKDNLGKWICKTWAPVIEEGTTVQETTVQESTVQETTVQETTVQETTVQETTVQETTVDQKAPIYVENQFRPTSYSLSLKDNIAINFRVKPETLVGYTNPYLEVTMNGEKTVLNEYKTLDDGTVVFEFDKVYPQTVIDDASAVLHAFKGEQEYYGEPYVKSVKEYAVNNMARSTNPNSLRGLLVNLLRYAAEAQKFTHYKEDDLASNYIDNSAKRFAKTQLNDLVDVKNYSAEPCPGTVKATFTSGTLVLGSNVGIKVGFNVDSLENKSIRVDFNGESKYYEADQLAPNGNGKGTFTYSVYANQLHETVKFTVCEGANHTPISDTMTYSAASYASKYITNENVGSLLKELMLYGQAAETYAAG